ncbi:hypothetical protein GCM10011571_17050 [Marinithermofilum abyssi]|uniref:Uncharacterized protein n=1 Tax=Marinithermofilum abyssi TaxID=1571185 RepID=A0A8J2VDQ5_9BACL|nr:hypothetical protein [Marinithermofilum abyssi]GGE16025.1 hypothetical protein GCM10011571_17050 [Marinithermofilum abyssi]
MFRLTIIGHGSNGSRQVSYEYQINDIKYGYNGIPNTGWWEGADISVDLQCKGTSGNPDCIGDKGPDTRTVSEWRENPRGDEAFNSNPPPKTVENIDQVSYMDIWPRITVNPPGVFPERSGDGEKQKVRADSADYLIVYSPRFWPKAGAIFADVKPVFYYQENDSYFDIMDPAFEQHKQAMTDPANTFPPRPGKTIPGQSVPLTRLYKEYNPVRYDSQ